jgi:hypothetical protein
MLQILSPILLYLCCDKLNTYNGGFPSPICYHVDVQRKNVRNNIVIGLVKKMGLSTNGLAVTYGKEPIRAIETKFEPITASPLRQL